MTVIAWDGNILASDRQITDSCRATIGKKLWKVKMKTQTYLLGLSGEYGPGLAAINTIINTESFDGLAKDRDVSIMVIGKKAIFEIESGYVIPVLEMKVWATGSGGDYALGAMLAGKTAVEAVEIAIQLDMNSGLGVDQVQF